MSEEKEPKIKWVSSKAQKLLLQDLVEEKVPLTARDENNKSTMALKTIYNMRPEYKEYLYENFSHQLAGLREIVKNLLKELEKMSRLFNCFVKIMRHQCIWNMVVTSNGKEVKLRNFF